jgi:transcription antitermination protein NusB
MASNRHLGRIVALQVLYEFEFRSDCKDPNVDVDEIIARSIQRYEETIDDVDFIKELVVGAISKQPDLDASLQPIAPDWPLAQIARIDRTIMRMALWELLHNKSVPPKVVINEAVELAKAFGADSSSKFVNGVLGTAYRTLIEPGAVKPDSTKPSVVEPSADKTAKPAVKKKEVKE